MNANPVLSEEKQRLMKTIDMYMKTLEEFRGQMTKGCELDLQVKVTPYISALYDLYNNHDDFLNDTKHWGFKVETKRVNK